MNSIIEPETLVCRYHIGKASAGCLPVDIRAGRDEWQHLGPCCPKCRAYLRGIWRACTGVAQVVIEMVHVEDAAEGVGVAARAS